MDSSHYFHHSGVFAPSVDVSENLPSEYLDLNWFMAAFMNGHASTVKRSIDECGNVYAGAWKKRRLNPILANRPTTSRRPGRHSCGSLHIGNDADPEIIVSSGFASADYKFTFNYKITPTRATDSSRVMQRQKYPAFRRPTSSPFMRLVYGVPVLASTNEAYMDLPVRLASAASSGWPISVADMVIPAFPPGLPTPSGTPCVT